MQMNQKRMGQMARGHGRWRRAPRRPEPPVLPEPPAARSRHAAGRLDEPQGLEYYKRHYLAYLFVDLKPAHETQSIDVSDHVQIPRNASRLIKPIGLGNP